MKIKQKVAALTIFVMVFGLFGLAGTATAKTFSDVNSDYWAKTEIEYLSGQGIINGYSDGRFGINDPISRAQAAAMLIRSLGWEVSGQDDPGYEDVSPSHWAYDEIAVLKHADIFALEGKFEPDKLVTRAEMAQMLVNTFDLRSTSGAKFSDLDRSHPAYDAINILATNRITTGYTDGSFRPDNRVSRTEFAVFVSRALDESFRPAANPELTGVQIIYDIEIGESYVQLDEPMMLRGTWLAPAQLFTNMGITVTQTGGDTVSLMTPDNVEIVIGKDEQEVWVGDTLVELTVGFEEYNGQLYIEAGRILRTLEKPLVYYPEQRLIRIESPRITVADIKANAPDTIVNVVHEELPYWQWTKRDHDYLLKQQHTGSVDRASLLQEMQQLTDAFYAVEQEKTVVRGLNYYSDHVTGKLDAISRGLEARYSLLSQTGDFTYPAIGKSGALGVFGYLDNHIHQYTVADHSYDHFDQRKQELIQVIESSPLRFEQFKGLNIFGAPFTIVEHRPDGSIEAWSGKAIGSQNMLVSGSILGTFIHEFGHNWDAAYGDHEEYLALRNKAGYVPASSSWGERIEENFAEDFVQAFVPDGITMPYKADFGAPTAEETAAFIAWVEEREREVGAQPHHYLTVNGTPILPDVLMLPNGQLHLQGSADNVVHVYMQHLDTGEETQIEIPSYGSEYSEVITLPKQGVYYINVGSLNITAIYE